MGASGCGDDLYRISPHVVSAVRLGLSRYAAALSRLSAGVSSSKRYVDRRRVDTRSGLFAAADLFDLVAALRRRRRHEPMEGDWPRVANALAAADRQLRRNANRHARALRLCAR